jgi:hypothetical protein
MTQAPLTAAEREMLAALGDVLIPPSPGQFSASEAGLGGELADILERHAPERIALVRHAVGFAGSATPALAIARLRAEDSAAYDRFCETVAAVYFMAPKVRDAVGFPGRLPKPARIDVTEIEDLLEPVLESGFAPRPTPAR